MKRSARFLVVGLAIVLGPLSGGATRAEEPAAGPGTALLPPQPLPQMPVPEALRGAGPPAQALEAAAPPPPQEPVALAPALSTGFLALNDNLSFIPPDTHGAVGPSHLMVTLNTQVRIQNRTGGVLSTVTLNSFFSSVNGGGGAFDPRVVFDPLGGRFVVVAADDQNSASAGLLIAVSQTADPLGAWYFDRISVPPSVWADFPTLGFNNRWVVVQVNMFDVGAPSSGPFNRTHIYTWDKSELYAGTFNENLISQSGISGTQVPAAVYDPAESDLYLLQMWNSDDTPTMPGGSGFLRLYRLSGATAAPTFTPVGFVSAPPWFHEAAGRVDFAPQLQGPTPGCSVCPSPPCKIQANDSRIQNLVLRNGTLWAAHTVLLPEVTPNRSSIQWWQIATDTTVLQRGLVDDPGGLRFFAFPSIAVNTHEDVLLGYSSYEGTQYAAGSYSFRTALDPPGTMQAESILKAGEACYFKDGGTGRNRWGDYSATVVDPTDDVKLWTLQEFAATPSGPFDRWGTWWGLLDPTPEVRIDDVSASEGDSGTTAFGFRVRLTDAAGTPLPTSQTVTVDWQTGNGTATTGDLDYAGVAFDTLTFLPGETVQFIDVTVNGDLKLEGNETFFVDLTGATNATIADNQASGTILNDDPVPQVSIGDVTLVEGTAAPGTFTNFVFPVTLSNPRDTDINVTWATANGTAVAGPYNVGDFVGLSASVLIVPAGTVSVPVTVQVHPDTLIEPAPDEVFYVDLSAPVGATLLKPRGVGRIQDDDTANPGVLGFSVVSDSTAPGPGTGRNRLQWLTPSSVTAADLIHIRYTEGATCTPPALGGGSGPILVPANPGNTQRYVHSPLILDRQYCYSIWIESPATVFSVRRVMSARPFDSSPPNKVKWKHFVGTTALAPPTVGLDAVVGVSNTMFVHAMERNPLAARPGEWPASWKPLPIGGVAQHRAPIVPLGGVSRAFISDQNGWVHAVDTATGNLLWSTQLPEGAAQGAPAGIFTAWGGAGDYVLVGTSAGSNNRIYALDPFTGAVIDAFPGAADGPIGSLGPIYGAGTVDYAANRVFFASRRGGAGKSLWCLEIGPPSDALRLGWSRDLGIDVDGSPVLRGGRVYVVDNAPVAWSIPAATGLGGYSRALVGAPLLGFLFPDRRNNDLYVSTVSQVHGLVDTGSALNNKWAPIASLNNLSGVLLQPGTNNLYVGVRSYSGDASLVRIDTATGLVAGNVTLDTGALAIGAPSLDNVFEIIHVGSEAGILYAVELPF